MQQCILGIGNTIKWAIEPYGAPETKKWKRISCKPSARLQHLSQLKNWCPLLLAKKLVVKKCNNLYLGLVMPSSGW
jgi:hypothetical protein